MKSVKRDDGWWVTDIPDCQDCGPYDTKAAAEDDRKGMERTEKYGHKRSFWTSTKPCVPYKK
jgi:hypothetical protein